MSIALLALGLIFLVTLVLTLTEPFPVFRLLFEARSAFGTVGLSTGLTPDLSLFGKMLMVMYFGVSVLILHRRQEVIVNPSKHKTVGAGDTLIVGGRDGHLEAMRNLLDKWCMALHAPKWVHFELGDSGGSGRNAVYV